MTQYPTIVLDNNGNRILLGGEVARGGEGTIFSLTGTHSFVAKIYHKSPPRDRAEKITAMVASSDDSLVGVAAWPNRVLFSSPTSGVVGFIMPAVIGYQELHLLHSPQSRRHHFPQAGWNFLVHVATNIARAFEVVHAHGHVIGDVNDRNIMVQSNGTVKFVDCDSFQIRTTSKIYQCGIGAATHTPPELQNRPLKDEVRTVNQDCFGLAVLIFQLLFMGRHPFAGRFEGVGEMPLETAIAEYRFPYGSSASSMQMSRPPGSMNLQAVSPNLARLFERAFSEEGVKLRNRPLPAEWLSALGDLNKHLKRCTADPSHYYYSGEQTCTWCRLHASSGISFFSSAGASPRVTPPTSSILDLWKRIDAIPSPPPVFTLSVSTNPMSQPASARASDMAAALRRATMLSVIVAVILVVSTLRLAGSSEHRNSMLIGSVAVGAVIYQVGTYAPRQYRKELRDQKKTLESSLASLDRRLANAGPKEFETIKRELGILRQEAINLPATREEKLKNLRETARQRQLAAHLDRHKVGTASITGIGAARAAMLVSFGIESAADVSAARIGSIPGFGPTLTGAMLAWRRDLERRFTFDPARAVSQQDVARLDAEIARRELEIREKLADGLIRLEAARKQAMAEQSRVAEAARPMLDQLKQVQADLARL